MAIRVDQSSVSASDVADLVCAGQRVRLLQIAISGLSATDVSAAAQTELHDPDRCGWCRRSARAKAGLLNVMTGGSQWAFPARPGGLWPRPHCGSRLEFQTRGQMGQTQSRPPSTTWTGNASMQQALLHPVHPLWPSLALPVHPSSSPRAPPPGPPGCFREVAWVFDVYVVLCADSQGHQLSHHAGQLV
jgi:hypothetical protein